MFPGKRYDCTHRLIPGGRFLLTSGVLGDVNGAVGESIAQMTVWDLGAHNSPPDVQPITVASTVITRGFPNPWRRLQLGLDLGVVDEARLAVVASYTAGEEGLQV